MQTHCGGLLFTSDFDSGNLARVELVRQISEDDDKPTGEFKPDYDFKLWTKPDCEGTESENGNRSWFYFGVKKWTPGKVIRLTVMNLNKQIKLYKQGMLPLVRTVPGRSKWERVRDRIEYELAGCQFRLSFTYRFPDVTKEATTYFAFSYPHSYEECQQLLSSLDKKFEYSSNLRPGSASSCIYYKNEVVCKTLDGLNVNLLTITSCRGMKSQQEKPLTHLFPNKTARPHVFQGKRVYFLTSRVHPGEVPSSHVFNGFLDFITKEDDTRAAALRDHFVFKMIPMLNPDGVQRGHYRTDSQGVNLNRVYIDPDPLLHSPVFAVKSLLIYYHQLYSINSDKKVTKENTILHVNKQCEKDITETAATSKLKVSNKKNSGRKNSHGVGVVSNSENLICDTNVKPVKKSNSKILVRGDAEKQPFIKDNLASNCKGPGFRRTDSDVSRSSVATEFSEDDFPCLYSSSGSDKRDLEVLSRVFPRERRVRNCADPHFSNAFSPPKKLCARQFLDNSCEETKDVDSRVSLTTSELIHRMEGLTTEDNLRHRVLEKVHWDEEELRKIGPFDSGVAFYVDLHGHASKRGCFIYGNHFDEEEYQVEAMLFSKLISLNTAHFDFAGCNFTTKNMYTKDKRDGMSKAGSGRVAMYNTLGIIHSYTLECNYNTGIIVNVIPPSINDRASPPPLIGLPPRYNPLIWGDVGKALAIAALDMVDQNPWSRLYRSEYGSLNGVRDWIQRQVKAENIITKNNNLPKRSPRRDSLPANILSNQNNGNHVDSKNATHSNKQPSTTAPHTQLKPDSSNKNNTYPRKDKVQCRSRLTVTKSASATVKDVSHVQDRHGGRSSSTLGCHSRLELPQLVSGRRKSSPALLGNVSTVDMTMFAGGMKTPLAKPLRGTRKKSEEKTAVPLRRQAAVKGPLSDPVVVKTANVRLTRLPSSSERQSSVDISSSLASASKIINKSKRVKRNSLSRTGKIRT